MSTKTIEDAPQGVKTCLGCVKMILASNGLKLQTYRDRLLVTDSDGESYEITSGRLSGD